MRKHDEYLVTIDTIYPDSYTRSNYQFVRRDMLEPQPRPVFRTGLGGVIDRFVDWRARRTSLASLQELDDNLLADVGLRRPE